MRTLLLTLLTFSLAAASTTGQAAEEKLRVLIVDGQNNHNWKDTSPFMEKQLEASGRFDVDISTSPNENAEQSEWDAWRPKFSDYDVVLSNFNNRKTKAGTLSTWPKEVQKAFEDYVGSGNGLVNVHAANNAHKGWAEFEKMTGLLWRNAGEGRRLALDTYGDLLRMPVGKGPGAGHGPQHPFTVVIRDHEHPITKGMPKEFLHPKDELYHGQRGPAEDMNILATAYSDKAQKGTGDHEPMLWWIPYREGRVVTNVLGHVGGNSSVKDAPGMRDVGFLTMLKRSLEWAAGEKVTTPIPDNFPTAEEISIIEIEE